MSRPRLASVVAVGASLVLLVGCSEEPQTYGSGGMDDAPYAGTGKPYVDAGWKAGDKASWEAHLKTRTQRGQNDYYGVKN